MKKWNILLILILLLTTKAFSQTFPNEKWSYNEQADKEGWDSKKAENFRHYIIDSTNVTGLLIIHKGEIVFDYGDTEENSYIASIRKSILSMLYGKYVENGQMDLDKTLKQLNIEDITPLLPIEKQATVRDLISARSGVYLNGSNPGDSRQHAPERGSKKPGSYWLYNNWDFNTAGNIFEKETGKNIYDEVEDQLAIPLHMQDWDKSLQYRSGDTTVSKFKAYHMVFSTRDMARIGLLMLNRGKWNDKQVLPSNWVDMIVAEHTKPEEIIKNLDIGAVESPIDMGYGYMWWLMNTNKNNYRFKNSYTAMGYLGQAITVFPAIETVVVFKTKSDYERSNNTLTELSLYEKSVNIYDKK